MGMRILSALIFTLSSVSCSESRTAEQDYYQIKIYKLDDKVQELRVDKFLKDAYIPAMHRAGISKVGVFKPVEGDTIAGNVIIVWIPFHSLQQFAELDTLLFMDKVFLDEGKDYLDAAYNNVPYQRIESVLLKAFSRMPQYKIPSFQTSPGERIYELRSYQGPTEKLYRRKVEMFNYAGEIKLFETLGFNAVFYGEVISGSTMPNLMYMTTFSDMKSRDEHWNTFRNHPDWKAMSGLEKYKNTVSKSVILLLHPTDYSDI